MEIVNIDSDGNVTLEMTAAEAKEVRDDLGGIAFTLVTKSGDKLHSLLEYATPKKRSRPSLATDCRCGHTYNWHVPGGVCQVPDCVCKKHVTRTT